VSDTFLSPRTPFHPRSGSFSSILRAADEGTRRLIAKRLRNVCLTGVIDTIA